MVIAILMCSSGITVASARFSCHHTRRRYSHCLRLDLQHHHWQETVEHLIHLQITIEKDGARILDIARGTG